MTQEALGLAIAAGLALLLLVVLLLVRRSRRSSAQRLVAVVQRLGDDGDGGDDHAGLERAMIRLERAAGAAVARAGELEAVTARFRLALAEAGLGIVVCDDGGEVVFENDHARRVWDGAAGVLAREALGRLLEGAAGGEAASEVVDLYGPPRTVLEITATPLASETRDLGAVAVVVDVTERRRLEAMRRDFVANISHELKTPVGALGLLAETMVGEDDPEVLARLGDRIQAESARVNRIIDELLDLSRIESEEEHAREPVPLHLVVAQAVEQIRATAEQRRIRILVGEPPPQVTVPGDRRQLVSALFNLLENGVKYSDDGSSVEVGGRAGPEWIELRVSDHGPGIPGNDLERIFERFYRVDRSRGRDTGGTGLGLAIVRHVARNHGGDVVVDSVEGEGSTFTLVLPAGPALAGRSEPVAGNGRAP